MNIRLSKSSDLPVLMDIFSEARGTIAQLGIDQWQNGYPSEAVIEEDVVRRFSWGSLRKNVFGDFGDIVLALLPFLSAYAILKRMGTSKNSFPAECRLFCPNFCL